jgi:hypothetical protein
MAHWLEEREWIEEKNRSELLNDRLVSGCPYADSESQQNSRLTRSLYGALRPGYGWLGGEDRPLNSSFCTPRFVAAT